MTAQAGKKRYGKRGFSRASDAARGLIHRPLAKRGFAQSRLLTEWDHVVGADMAELVRPLRLSHAAKEGMGGTLTLGVLGVRALEAQHQEPAIIERVNAHYGYRAVARIRLSQLGAEAFAKAKLESAPPQPSSAQEAAVKSAVAPIADDDLRAALERLGRNIATRNL
jgi:hypothetical protein